MIYDPSTGRIGWTKHAARLIQLGKIERVNNQLQVTSQQMAFQQRLADAEAEKEFNRSRSGIIYWNGSRGSDRLFPPGRVRS